jgi:hypothetical protein
MDDPGINPAGFISPDQNMFLLSRFRITLPSAVYPGPGADLSRPFPQLREMGMRLRGRRLRIRATAEGETTPGKHRRPWGVQIEPFPTASLISPSIVATSHGPSCANRRDARDGTASILARLLAKETVHSR